LRDLSKFIHLGIKDVIDYRSGKAPLHQGLVRFGTQYSKVIYSKTMAFSLLLKD